MAKKSYQGPVRLSDLSGDHVKKASADQAKRPSQQKEKPRPAQDLVQAAQALKAKKLDQKPQRPGTDNDQEKSEEAGLSGEITKIEAQKRRKHRFNIYLNQSYAFPVSEATLVKFALAKGQVLSAERVGEIQAAEAAAQAYQTAVNYLSHQLRSEKEIRQRLQRDDWPEGVIDQTIQRLKELRLVDDLVYGQSYTRTAMRLQKKGPGQIQRKLKEKGLSESIIQQALEEYDDQTAQDNIEELAAKRLKQQMRKYAQRDSEQRTVRYLMQKGFDSDAAKQAVQRASQDLVDDDLEDDKLDQQGQKYWRKYRRLDPKERYFKVKQQLYRRGFEAGAIKQWLDQEMEKEEG
ncbi:recombination regulator RecX [Aerococcus sanguinicola]|uniref:Regulatory protein RecX n=1 Tax=Aerococcus sanguinicola TaxID=119206 RepID=A0A109RDJ0_9LACT|nr:MULTISPECIES: recombination regulator RecX [Aerococcus]AMB94446.1 hypothetical protein AWM72_06560 [Aerococcus sanguinicola]MDK7051075.1 recombination regulator RecX [Aerococcus sanguinicola]OFT98066.1 hypothetical protein HMPREF3090_00175 [Aerococcus sp. HMSC23C02]PKZ20445.1 recombination regulator RecX [Aerococcus sanguinicola]